MVDGGWWIVDGTPYVSLTELDAKEPVQELGDSHVVIHLDDGWWGVSVGRAWARFGASVGVNARIRKWWEAQSGCGHS